MDKRVFEDSVDDMIHVFQLPPVLPPGYCFGGGLSVRIVLSDFFNGNTHDGDEVSDDELRDFLRHKPYRVPGTWMLVVRNDGRTLMIPPEDSSDE